MSEQLAGVVEGQASEGDISSRQHTRTLRFAKLGLTALTATLLLGVGGAHAICPCGDEVCGGPACTPPETAQTCPADCGSVSPITPQPSRPGDIIDCTEKQRDEIGLAADWVADNWTAFEAALEDIRGWPVNIKNCLQNRFAKNGKVVCEQSSSGMCNGANAWASKFNRKAHFCPGWLNTVAENGGMEDRQGCYIAELTHEWANTCEREHKTIEIFDNEAFKFWKSEHPGVVTIRIGNCGMD